MSFFKAPKIKDLAYRKSFKGRECIASRNGIDLCGLRSVETVVGAHINDEEYSGWGNKAEDNLIIALCFDCHFDQTNNPGASWYLENITKPMARRMYREYKQGNSAL